MTRMLKMVGLLVSAIAALSVAMAPAAQAETGVLTAQQYPAILTAEQLGGVTFDIGELPIKTVSCGTSDLDGTLVGPMDPVTFQPTYAGCVAEPGAAPVTVTTNGCDYNLGFTRPGTTGQQEPTTGTMQAWINCPVGQQIEIHVYENAANHGANISQCTYDIGPQGPVPAGIYHNTFLFPNDVDATVNARFTAKRTAGPGMICGGMNPLQHLPVTLTGNYTLKGFQDFGFVEGAQIGVDVG